MLRVLLILCLLCASCHRKESSETSNQIARLSLSSEPPSLDPRTARDFSGSAILQMLFAGLPALAEKMEISENGLQYTFHMRKTNWSDGEPLTAFDFISSWKTILDPQFATDIAYHFFPIKNARKAKLGAASLDEVGVRAEGAYTLVVELEQPIASFIELLEIPQFFPVQEKGAASNPFWAHEAKTFVSNGPFRMKEWMHTDQIVLEKNPYYFAADQVQLDEIDLVIASDDTALRMFEEGHLDWIGSPFGEVPVDAMAKLQQGKQVQASPFLATSFLRLNTGKNPLSSVAMRRALALALNREAIVSHVLQGGQRVATRLVPPEMGLAPEGYFNDRDVDRALEFLDQAREEMGGAIAPLVISFAKDTKRALIAQAIQSQWKENLHIEVELEAIEPKVYFQRLSKGDLQIALGSWTADFNDPTNFLEVFKFKDNGTNNTGWENGRYVDLLNRSAVCRDLEERRQIQRVAESLLMEEMPLIPLYHFVLNYLKKDDLEGVALSPLGYIDLREAHRDLHQPSLHKR